MHHQGAATIETLPNEENVKLRREDSQVNRWLTNEENMDDE